MAGFLLKRVSFPRFGDLGGTFGDTFNAYFGFDTGDVLSQWYLIVIPVFLVFQLTSILKGTKQRDTLFSIYA